MDMAPATIGGGRYQLDGLLGRGGMAEVRQARDLRLGRTVAVKRLRADLALDPTFQARFRREAQSAAALNHPAVVAVYDTGEEPAPDGSDLMLPFIVMEYVEGRTLRDILRDGRKILPERALEIASSVLTALDYSHRAGIIHRDIKPANVMLTPTGDVKVMDFGIARAIADSSVTITQTAAVIGTAQYLSPEQASGEQVDARSDIYSTGCLLYELLTGRPPFVGDSALSVAYQHVRAEPTPPSALDPEISPEIDAITMKALAKPLDERYQSAIEMRADVERALDGVSVLAPPVIGAAELPTERFLAEPTQETSVTAVDPAFVAAEEDDPERRRTGLWVGALLALAALVIAGLVLVPQLIAGSPPAQVRVPIVNGLTVNAAQRKLESAGLQLGKQTPAYSSTVKAGRILRQGTDPHTLVDEGSAVDVVVSTGTNTVVIPTDITSLTLQQATQRLRALHLRVHAQPDDQSTERRNQVTTTDPGPGVEVPIRSTVTVHYSAGDVIVPSVVGMRQQAAVATLRAHDLVPTVFDTFSTAPAGTVTRQSLQAGTHQQRGTSVVIEVSKGPPPTPTTTAPTSTAPTTTAPTTTVPTTTAPTTTTRTSTTPPPTTAPSSTPSTTGVTTH
jgi:eukaryotic-like serine/threonine-protein kinase